MTKDIIYIFDKLSFQGQIFGEIQSGFNMSKVIDGTKDSCRVVVWSFQEHEIEPYTILFHKKTFSWWVVSHDKVERRQNDIGFYLVHNIDLLGAIELLNARDLTDCGFNDNKYTIKTFIDRLLALSTFEYNNYEIVANNNIDLNKKVDFIKTFENYTLLSALREFLDAYNTSAKLDFDYIDNDDILTITKAYITLISKTGNLNSQIIDVDDFDDVRETKTLDKNSFGSCVISNANNVISSIPKTFPSVGSIKLSSNEINITPQNSILRLPSNVFKGNWLKIIYPIPLRLVQSETGSGESSLGTITYKPQNENSFDDIVNQIYNIILSTPSPFAEERAEAIKEQLILEKNNIINILNSVSCVTLYEGNKLVPTFDNGNSTIEIEKGENVPYLTKLSYAQGQPRIPFIFTDKNTKQMLQHTLQGVSWERGSNVISGFEFLSSVLPIGGHSVALELTDYQSNTNDIFVHSYGTPNDYFCIRVDNDLDIDKKYVSFIVNYIPMSDIKIKVDNQVNKKDIQLYNQNGKLTDNFALSRLINSYAKEISSDNITKFAYFYDYSKVPQVGQLVRSENEYYVINNISMTFYENEGDNWVYDYVYYNTLYTLYQVENRTLMVQGGVTDNVLYLDLDHYEDKEFGYFIECEITMSNNIAVKSLMVNPNSNIRDYGIPQNFNVKRKQVYRDYYELTYDRLSDSNKSTPYFPTSEIFYLKHIPNVFNDLTCVIKIKYNEKINNSFEWYYQLETTNYYLNKMLYVMLDFNDNNIIGYGSQNVWSGFIISRIFSGLTDTLNTPISYVDNNGELESINICYCTNEQLTTIYQEYQDSQVGGDSYTGSLYNYSCFIPKEIYDKAKNNNKIKIDESNYNKDALEVPVFEYACQIGDSDDVVIGDNILKQYDSNCIYFYDYIIGDNITENNAIDTNTLVATTTPLGWRLYNGADISSSQGTGNTFKLTIKLYAYFQYWVNDGSWTRPSAQQTFQADKDYAFFRHSLNLMTGEENVDLLFITKKVPSDKITSNNLNIEINHYKLR